MSRSRVLQNFAPNFEAEEEEWEKELSIHLLSLLKCTSKAAPWAGLVWQPYTQGRVTPAVSAGLGGLKPICPFEAWNENGLLWCSGNESWSWFHLPS